MGIRKWMTFNSRLRRMLSSAKGGRGACALAMVICAVPAAAESKAFDLMVTPGLVIPAGNGLFLPAPASAFVLDFLPRKNIAVFLQGEFESVTVQSVAPIQLYDGSAGLGFIHPFTERLSARGDFFAGVYTAQRKSDSAPVNISGLSAGVRGTALLRLSPSLSAGLHASLRHFAYMPEPFLTGFGAGLSVVFNLSEFFVRQARVEAAAVRQDPVFPVFYSYYDDHDFATVRLTNREDAAITDISASFYLEQYMAQPGLCASIPRLAPGSFADIPVKAFFDSSMLEANEKADAAAVMTVRYRYLGAWREARIPLTVPVYNRNAMSWDDDRRAAAFASARDPAALWFAKYVSSAVNGDFRSGINRNLQYAMGIFDSLKNDGVSYVVDPASAYVDNAGSAGSIDFLQYPYQTLMYRGGDCDDLSILWCSLLEALDIESAFITIPGHIYAAFSTGLDEASARKEFADPSMLIFRNGKAWIPLEITLTREDFNKAWRIGAKEWHDAEARNTASMYPVREAWVHYPPVSVPGAASRFTLPDEKGTRVSFNATLDAYVAREIRSQVDSLKKKLASKDGAVLRNELGILYGRYGMIEPARIEFERSKALGGKPAVVNLGNLAFLSGEYDAALAVYTSALQTNGSDTLAILGAARCCYELGDFETSDGLYEELTRIDAALAAKYSYLNSFFDTTGRAWSLSERLETVLWSVDEGSEGNYIAALSADTEVQQSTRKTAQVSSVQNSAAPSVRDLNALGSQAEPSRSEPTQEEPVAENEPSSAAQPAVNQEPEAEPEPEHPTESVIIPESVPAAEPDVAAPNPVELPALAETPADARNEALPESVSQPDPVKETADIPERQKAVSELEALTKENPETISEQPEPVVSAAGLTGQLSINNSDFGGESALTRLLANANKASPAKPAAPDPKPAETAAADPVPIDTALAEPVEAEIAPTEKPLDERATEPVVELVLLTDTHIQSELSVTEAIVADLTAWETGFEAVDSAPQVPVEVLLPAATALLPDPELPAEITAESLAEPVIRIEAPNVITVKETKAPEVASAKALPEKLTESAVVTTSAETSQTENKSVDTVQAASVKVSDTGLDLPQDRPEQNAKKESALQSMIGIFSLFAAAVTALGIGAGFAREKKRKTYEKK